MDSDPYFLEMQEKAKQQKWEEIQLMKRKAEEQLRLLGMQEHALVGNGDEPEVNNVSARLGRTSLNGPVSEPTTPPEYNQGPYSSSRFSRSSRLSANSVISPPGLSSRLSQNSSQITSPAGRLSGSMYQAQRASTKSMPGSRRGSDEEEDYAEDLPNIRPAGRYVIPSSTCSPSHTPPLACFTASVSGNTGSLFCVLAQNRSDLHTLDLSTHLSLLPCYLPI